MPSIIIKNLSFGYGGFPLLFDNVSLNLDSSWKLGLAGRNGRGKTTFFKILEGKLPYTGTVSSPLPCRYFPCQVIRPEKNAYFLIESLGSDALAFQLEREASLLKLSVSALKRPLNELSGGELTKALLAALFLEEDIFPLIDEPTQRLDVYGRKSLWDYLSAKKGFFLVSHDRALLDQASDHTLYINRQGIDLEKGNFSSYLANREMREKDEERREEKLRKDIQRLKNASEKAGRWGDMTEKEKKGNGPVDRGFIGRKATKAKKRAKNIEQRRQKALVEKRALIRNTEESGRLSMAPLTYHGKPLAYGNDLTLGYSGAPVVRGLSFSLSPGSVLAVKGPNGSGKTLFLKLLSGKAEVLALEGDFHMAPGVTISYVPQKPEAQDITLKEFSLSMGADHTRFMTFLSRLGFEKSQFGARVSGLSQGQLKKAYLALSIASSAHLYVWDEPLSWVDIQSRMDIEKLILECRPTLVAVEHDHAFLEKVADDTLDFGRL
ncbi:MAG: ATP-binding cassette domain-containing protein [Deltaproteobacteria bacterium]|jgi:lincosamide and streptogramin A transport system ATP-binding/permease protein|nr:ATP-binding cassette domain-containing protein [Deltaproteobacteria bacterium]